MFDFFVKISDTIFNMLSTLFSIALNVILVPLSWLYSAVTVTLGGAWRIVNVKDVCYIYWSISNGIALITSKSEKVKLVLDSKNPRLVLLLFAIAVPVLVIGALLTILSNKLEAGNANSTQKSGAGRKNSKQHSKIQEDPTYTAHR